MHSKSSFHFLSLRLAIRSSESIRQCLLDQFNIDINIEHAQPQLANHSSSVTKSKPDFYSTKFTIIQILFQYLVNNSTSLTLSAAYDLVPGELREELKSENGGLKSIILSYRHALHFDPRTKLISLANPQTNSLIEKQKQSSKITVRTKPCFFYAFHPNGCPLTDEQCAFSHCSIPKDQYKRFKQS